jgi:hypothetical protein
MAERIEDGPGRGLSLRRVDTRAPAARQSVRVPPDPVVPFGRPAVRIVDFAPPDGEDAQAPRLALFADPWPGTIAVYGSTEGGGFNLVATVSTRATMGTLRAALGAGPLRVCSIAPTPSRWSSSAEGSRACRRSTCSAAATPQR